MKKQILILTLLLLQFGFSQEDLKMSSKLSECAALESDLARLACYDELAKKSVSVNNEKSETTNEMDVGSWRVGEDVNPIDDTKTFTAILTAKSGKSKWGDNIYIVLRYRSGKSEVYINWKSYLGSEAFVLTRLGSEKAKTTEWSLSSDSKATFYKGKSIDFIKKLRQNDKAVFQVTPYGDNPITAIFELKGLSAAIKPYSYMGW